MKKEKNERLDVARLLSLKAYERPRPECVEENVSQILRAVRAAPNPRPQRVSLNFGWFFAQPRYGIAALFVLFLGLHFVRKPAARPPVYAVHAVAPLEAQQIDSAAETNQMPMVPTIAPPGPFVRSPLVQPVSFRR